MMVSSFASFGASSASVPSTAAAGTISQTARGGFSFATNSSSEEAPTAPSAASACTASGAAVVDDALVAVLHEAAHHVGAHAAETDHSELHGSSWWKRSGEHIAAVRNGTRDTIPHSTEETCALGS